MDDFGAPIDPLDPLDYWRLCDELSVVQAALLIVGRDPSGMEDGIDLVRPSNRPVGYNAAKAALINAVNGKRLAARSRRTLPWVQATLSQSFLQPIQLLTPRVASMLGAWGSYHHRRAIGWPHSYAP
jgi:hypothetical protein